MTNWEAIPLMPGSSGLGWATREMGTAFSMGGASYLPWLAGSLEECPGEGYWLSFNQRLPISYELGDCLFRLLHCGWCYVRILKESRRGQEWKVRGSGACLADSY